MAPEARVDRLEQALADLAVAQVRTHENLDRLSEEMRDFKSEMAGFKNEMRGFKNEMADFKNEMRDFKNEMADFKNEMRGFKNEMADFKDDVQADRREGRRQWGELANKMGTLVEDIVAPSIPDVFRDFFGLDVLELSAQRLKRQHRTDRSRIREFDYVGMAGRLLLVNETKSTLRPEDLPQFLDLLAEVRDFLPEADGREVIGSLAAFRVDPGLVVAGERHGLLMFGLGGGLLDVLNTPGFAPRRF